MFINRIIIKLLMKMDKFLLKQSPSISAEMEGASVSCCASLDNSGSSDSDETGEKQTIPTKCVRSVVRRYDEKYLAYGFIGATVSDQPRPQRVICSAGLSNESLNRQTCVVT